MLFALDYDGTFSAAPDLFREFRKLAERFGHRVVVVTGRSDEGRWGDEVREVVGPATPIVFCAGRWKRAAAEAAGYQVDVWVDDNPEYVGPQDPRLTAHKAAQPEDE